MRWYNEGMEKVRRWITAHNRTVVGSTLAMVMLAVLNPLGCGESDSISRVAVSRVYISRVDLTGDPDFGRGMEDFPAALLAHTERQNAALQRFMVELPNKELSEQSALIRIRMASDLPSWPIDHNLLPWGRQPVSTPSKIIPRIEVIDAPLKQTLTPETDRILQVHFTLEGKDDKTTLRVVVREVAATLERNICNKTFASEAVLPKDKEGVILDPVVEYVSSCLSIHYLQENRASGHRFEEAYGVLLASRDTEQLAELLLGIEDYDTYIMAWPDQRRKAIEALVQAMTRFKRATTKDPGGLPLARFLLVHAAITYRAMCHSEDLAALNRDTAEDLTGACTRAERFLHDHVDTAFSSRPFKDAVWTKALALESIGRDEEAERLWGDLHEGWDGYRNEGFTFTQMTNAAIKAKNRQVRLFWSRQNISRSLTMQREMQAGLGERSKLLEEMARNLSDAMRDKRGITAADIDLTKLATTSAVGEFRNPNKPTYIPGSKLLEAAPGLTIERAAMRLQLMQLAKQIRKHAPDVLDLVTFDKESLAIQRKAATALGESYGDELKLTTARDKCIVEGDCEGLRDEIIAYGNKAYDTHQRAALEQLRDAHLMLRFAHVAYCNRISIPLQPASCTGLPVAQDIDMKPFAELGNILIQLTQQIDQTESIIAWFLTTESCRAGDLTQGRSIAKVYTQGRDPDGRFISALAMCGLLSPDLAQVAPQDPVYPLGGWLLQDHDVQALFDLEQDLLKHNPRDHVLSSAALALFEYAGLWKTLRLYTAWKLGEDQTDPVSKRAQALRQDWSAAWRGEDERTEEAMIQAVWGRIVEPGPLRETLSAIDEAHDRLHTRARQTNPNPERRLAGYLEDAERAFTKRLEPLKDQDEQRELFEEALKSATRTRLLIAAQTEETLLELSTGYLERAAGPLLSFHNEAIKTRQRGAKRHQRDDDAEVEIALRLATLRVLFQLRAFPELFKALKAKRFKNKSLVTLTDEIFSSMILAAEPHSVAMRTAGADGLRYLERVGVRFTVERAHGQGRSTVRTLSQATQALSEDTTWAKRGKLCRHIKNLEQDDMSPWVHRFLAHAALDPKRYTVESIMDGLREEATDLRAAFGAWCHHTRATEHEIHSLHWIAHRDSDQFGIPVPVIVAADDFPLYVLASSLFLLGQDPKTSAHIIQMMTVKARDTPEALLMLARARLSSGRHAVAARAMTTIAMGRLQRQKAPLLLDATLFKTLSDAHMLHARQADLPESRYAYNQALQSLSKARRADLSTEEYTRSLSRRRAAVLIELRRDAKALSAAREGNTDSAGIMLEAIVRWLRDERELAIALSRQIRQLSLSDLEQGADPIFTGHRAQTAWRELALARSR